MRLSVRCSRTVSGEATSTTARGDGWIVVADDQKGAPDALAAQAGELLRAGATWWVEHLHGYRGSMEQLVTRVRAGPPG